MNNNSKSWDDIPSIEGLGVDWNFEPENPMGKRVYARLTAKELYVLFQTKEFPVRLLTEQGEFLATLVDISQGGVALHVQQGDWQESQLVKFGFFLGKQKIISRGWIKNVRKQNNKNLLGIEFVGLSGENHDYISTLYSSVKISK